MYHVTLQSHYQTRQPMRNFQSPPPKCYAGDSGSGGEESDMIWPLRHDYVPIYNTTTFQMKGLAEQTNEWKKKETNIVLHHNNLCQNVSNFVLNFLQKKCIRTVSHPPYSLNLAHCNFYLFPELKKISAANDLQLRMHCTYSIIWHTIRTCGPNHPSSVPWEEHICVQPNISLC
jgi:hypothetical protein